MRIRRIRMVNFRAFADYELALDPGLNLVVGGNESGKSTIVEALATALFADPTSKARAIRELERWGSSGAMRLELDFDHGDSCYSLQKDFGEGRVELADRTTKQVVADRSEVDKLVKSMVGFATRDAFESVAAVRQGELAVLNEKKGRRGELVPMIERKMTSSSGIIDAASVVERVDREIARLRKGTDNPAKNPGPIRVLLDKRDQLKREIGELRATWAAVAHTMNELSRDRERHEKASTELERIDRAVRCEDRQREVAEKLAKAKRGLDERETKIGRVRTLRKDLEEAWGRLGDTAYGHEKRAIVGAKADLEASDRRGSTLTASAPAWAGEGSDRRAAIATAAAGLVAFALVLGGTLNALAEIRLWLILGGIGAAVAAALLFRRTLRIWAFARNLRTENQERQKLATILMAALSRLGFPNYAEFEHAVEVDIAAQGTVDKRTLLLSEVCGGQDPAACEEELEREASTFGRQHREFESELQELGGFGVIEPSELAKLRAERETLRQEVDSLAELVSRHEWEIGRREAEQSLADREAGLEMVEREREALERQLGVLSLARQSLEAALASTKEEAASALEPVVGRILSRVTLERYADVSIGRDLGLSVGNPSVGAGGPPTVETCDLSTGTVDQLYMAIRFALLEFLATREGSPFVLDDALVNSDPGRRSAALRLLHEISEERQVIMLSCEEHASEFADAVIVLPGVAHGLETASQAAARTR